MHFVVFASANYLLHHTSFLTGMKFRIRSTIRSIMLLGILLLTICIAVNGQPLKDTILLHDVIVTTYKEEPVHETSLNITPLNADSAQRFGNFTVTDMLSRLPGVTMLSTGNGIAKPVIRGLYGNRILVLLSGLKFDNQQWQEEHGLGLSDIGITSLEVIKGPMSVLYGTEAMGGIINITEEQKPAYRTSVSDVGFRFNSNTLGTQLQAGYKKNNGNRWYSIRLGTETQADYRNGHNQRVLNSRFDGQYLKSSFGFAKRNWTSDNHFSASFNRFGFIFNDVYTFITPDARWSRKLNVNPAHLVVLGIFNSENKILLKNHSLLTVNAGLQSNRRMENEGGGAISLNMQLSTGQYLIKWEKEITEDHRIILSHLSSVENNTNYGARKIIPDAWMQESNLSVYDELHIHKTLVLENGLGAGEKYIHTLLTPMVNSAEKDIKPFSKLVPYYNLYSGFSYFPNNTWNLKTNIATGVRIPNLAELSSNGLHEGVFTYEIGSPSLKNEQMVSANVYVHYNHKGWDVYLSPFYNFFHNYIYLSPTSELWFGFPVYRYRQQQAMQYGTEATVQYTFLQRHRITVSYAGMNGKTADGNYIPFTPAQKISPMLEYFSGSPTHEGAGFFIGMDFYFAQHLTAPGEMRTPAYRLLNSGLSYKKTRHQVSFEMRLSGNNLLNAAYYDHLSRFKYFGILNMGRNIGVQLIVKQTQKKHRVIDGSNMDF